MKFIFLALISTFLAVPANARECATPAALNQAMSAMRAELESDLVDQARTIFLALKARVPLGAYAQMQQYNKPLNPIQAIPVEASLAQQLQIAATSLDPTANCERETRYSNGSPAGVIHWSCTGQKIDLGLLANGSMGDFTVVMKRKGGKGLEAPIAFTHSVRIEERYNKIAESSMLSPIIFPVWPLHSGSGNVASVDIKWENFDKLIADLAKANQSCD